MTQPTDPQAARIEAQKRRNLWLALALAAFVILVGVTTAIRIQDADFSGENGFYFSGKMPEMSRAGGEDAE